jgi:hypothetical protein
VPIVHKPAAVSEIIAQLAIEADEDPEWPRPAIGRQSASMSRAFAS